MTWLLANWKAIALAALVSASFFAGWFTNGWRWEAKAYAAEQRAEQSRIDLAQDNAEIIAEYADKEAEVIHDTRIIYKTITRLAPAQCLDGVRSFRSIWNGDSPK